MAIHNSPLTSYSDTTPQKRVITDVISLIDPSDTPLVMALGGLDGASSKFRFVNGNGTKIEWLEDSLFALADTISHSLASNTTTISVSDGSKFQEGDIVSLGSADYAWVSTADNSGDVLTVTRAYGGTAASMASGQTITIIGQARLEGDDSDDRAFTDREAPYNYTQIFHHEVKVSRTQNQISQYGIDEELEYQASKAVPSLMRLIEKNLFYGQRKAGSATTPRGFGGLGTFITDNTASGASLAQSAFEDAAEAAYGDGGMGPWIAPLAPANMQKVKNFYDASAYLRVERDESTAGMVINRIATPFGMIDLLLDRWAPSGTIYLVDPKNAGLITYYPFSRHPLAVTGDYEREEVVGEFSLAVRQDKSHAKLTSVS
jgi:hypothetical protein